MLRVLERGLSLSDFESLTVGMMIGFIITYNNDHLSEDEMADNVREATQADYSRF